MGSGGELLGVEVGGRRLLDGKLDTRQRGGNCVDGRCWRRGSIGVVKVDVAWSRGEDGVILANGGVGARMPRGAALPEDDLAWVHDLACREVEVITIGRKGICVRAPARLIAQLVN